MVKRADQAVAVELPALCIVISKILLVETAYPGKAIQEVLPLGVDIHLLAPEAAVVLADQAA
jgi:hypothetical protein